ncbi:hypothetical protein DQ244_17225 [Blastococcus sp. TBT05-19]|uniref:hypothetical protein n=1 Tax=Blastococcus sp. TBT05-19 TaxID=2250581 RepID=UPI000DEBB096|nr:hypothetical protein [Blastococcus sp. TBT05-19]RBY87080.1 hypothetical protein DQ244_17225 [Blastococcus sp. TBT05-19]
MTVTDPHPTDSLSSLRRLKEHLDRGIRHATGSPIYDNAVRQLADLGSPLNPYEAIEAGLV